MVELRDMIGLARWAVADALQAATSIAGRAAEQFEGTDAAILFRTMRDAIGHLRNEGPEMKAISRASHMPMQGDLIRTPNAVPATAGGYEAVIYSHQDKWVWRIEDADGKTVEDSPGDFQSFGDALHLAAVNARNRWNREGK